jgi:hypothetical protein
MGRRRVKAAMTLLLTPDGLDEAIERAPLLLLGGLLLAIASPAWGGAGCISGVAAAWAGVLALIHIDWRGGARLLALGCLVPTLGLAVLVGDAVCAGAPPGRLLDLGVALAVLLCHVRFLLSVLLRRAAADTEVPARLEVPADSLARIPHLPGRQEIQAGRNGVRPGGRER